MSQSSESDSSSDEAMVTENPEKFSNENFQQFQAKFMQSVRISVQDNKMYSQSINIEEITSNNRELKMEEQELKQSTFEVKDQINAANVKLNFYQEMATKMEDQLEFFQSYYNDLIDEFNALELKRSFLQNQLNSNNAKCEEVGNLYLGLYTDLEDEIERKNNQLQELEVERNYYAQCQQETQRSLISMENDYKCQQEEMKNVDQECQKMTELQETFEALKCTENELMTALASQEELISANADSIRDSKIKVSQLEMESNQLAELTKEDEDSSKNFKETMEMLNDAIRKIVKERLNNMLKKQDQENREIAMSLNEYLKTSEQEALHLKEEEALLNAVMLKLDYATKEHAAAAIEISEIEAALTELEKSHLESMQPLQLQLENLQKEANDLKKTLNDQKKAFEEDKLTYEMKLAAERSKNNELLVQVESDKSKSFESDCSVSLISDDDGPNFKEKMNVICTRENIFKKRRRSDKEGKK